MITLLPGERLDYLVDGKLQIVQSSEVFSFSMDAVLLARFAYVPIQKGRILDLCTGNGVIPLLLSSRSKADIVGVEIQERLYDMAVRSSIQNGLTEQISFVHADIKSLPDAVTTQKYDVVTCNPPYFEAVETSDKNLNVHFAIARHELYCTLRDCIAVSSKMVKQKGKVAIVHRPDRLADIFMEMRHHGIEPKRLQLVYPTRKKEANIVLVEGIKNGNPGLKTLPPITVYAEDRNYTEQFKDIFYGRNLR